MGVSDRPYFAWLRAALVRYEAGLGHLSALGRERSPLDLWVLAGARTNPGIEFVRATLGHTALRFLDRFADDPGVGAWTSATSRACRMTPATSS